MRLHPDKGGNAEQFKDGCDMVESGSNLPVRLACLDITCASRESRLLEPGSTRGL